MAKFKEEIEKNQDENIRVTFKSPPILSSKLLLTPSLKKKYKNVNIGFSTLHSVGLLIAHTSNLYCNVIEKKEIESRAFKLGVLTNALSRVVGYNLKPVTAVIGKDSRGNQRKTRGVIGWLEFDIPYEKLKRVVLK